MDKDSIAVDFNASLDSLKNELYIDFEKSEMQRYKIDVLPGAITDFYGAATDTLAFNGTTRSTSDYGNMEITLSSGSQWPAIIQIVKEDLKVVKEQVASENGIYAFENIDPGSYLIRVIYDANKNGRYDTGNFLKGLQPEAVVYLPELITLQANWDVRETVILE
ncbi:hypothetical protein FNJ87_00440 [Nonlabens mediterrranea]|uniref:TonB-dependent receptor n=1 Tax=Nonlabens mediterrranea TaxID=1419947 RepID=A0ABS0A0I8_9FLAO|nr:hypothetical protein [Nonlabens mediterrranea]